MLRLRNVRLEGTARDELRRLQRRINSLGGYSEKVAEAKSEFARHNRISNPAFREVRAALTTMCSNSRRCAYCEDSVADEVEHIKPKDLYPDLAFVWKNYLYACGPCNGPKNNQFAVFSRRTGNQVEVSRKRGQPIVPPEPGAPVLIDPRVENLAAAIDSCV